MNILQQAQAESEYNFNTIPDFEVDQLGDIITVSYPLENGKPFINFMIVNSNTTTGDVLDFIEKHFNDAKNIEKYLMSLAF